MMRKTAGMPRVGIYCIRALPRGGMYWVHPCRASSIVSVKINTSLPMMREWVVHPFSGQCTDTILFNIPTMISFIITTTLTVQ